MCVYIYIYSGHFQILKIRSARSYSDSKFSKSKPLFTLSRRKKWSNPLRAWGTYNFVAGDVSSMWTVFLGTSLKPSLPKQYMTRTRKNNSNNTYNTNTSSSLLLLLRPLPLPPLPPPPLLVLLPFFKIIIHITQNAVFFRLLSWLEMATTNHFAESWFQPSKNPLILETRHLSSNRGLVTAKVPQNLGEGNSGQAKFKEMWIYVMYIIYIYIYLIRKYINLIETIVLKKKMLHVFFCANVSSSVKMVYNLLLIQVNKSAFPQNSNTPNFPMTCFRSMHLFTSLKAHRNHIFPSLRHRGSPCGALQCSPGSRFKVQGPAQQGFSKKSGGMATPKKKTRFCCWK